MRWDKEEARQGRGTREGQGRDKEGLGKEGEKGEGGGEGEGEGGRVVRIFFLPRAPRKKLEKKPNLPIRSTQGAVSDFPLLNFGDRTLNSKIQEFYKYVCFV